MDGVILDNNAWHKKSWLIFAEKYGFKLTDEDFDKRVYGKTNHEILKTEFPDASDGQYDAWAEEKEAIYREIYLPDFELVKGLPQLLDALKEKEIPTGVASNAPKINVDFALDTGKIRSFFQAIVYADLVPRPKPFPDIYLKTASILNRQPQNCVIFEDSLTGIAAAKAAGAKVIALTTTYAKRNLMLAGADRVIENFSGISTSDIEQVLINS
jgi:HAD superfamily hydrolase (TIGR01509 family)